MQKYRQIILIILLLTKGGHMKRKIYNKILEWKNTGMEKALMVIGAK